MQQKLPKEDNEDKQDDQRLPEIDQKFLQELLKQLPKELQVYQVSLIGNGIKGIQPPTLSNVEFRVVALFPEKEYMLQRVDPSVKHQVEIEGGTLHGKILDIFDVIKLAQQCKYSLVEIIQAQVLHTSSTFKQIEQMALETHDPEQLKSQYKGQFFCNKNRLDEGVKGQGLPESAIYFALHYLSVLLSPKDWAPYKIEDLVDKVFGKSDELGGIVKDIDVSELKKEVEEVLGLSENGNGEEKEVASGMPENIQKLFDQISATPKEKGKKQKVSKQEAQKREQFKLAMQKRGEDIFFGLWSSA